MKTVLSLFASFILFSCSTPETTTAELNRRISILEQRVDSLLNAGTSYSYSGSATVNTGSSDYSFANGQCKAITKRGKACKRKGKYNGYCWQHRG